jgi:hypothetical protein
MTYLARISYATKLCMPSEAMMSLTSGASGTHGHASEAESLVSHGNARALPHQGQFWSRRTRGHTGTLLCGTVGLVPRGMW